MQNNKNLKLEVYGLVIRETLLERNLRPTRLTRDYCIQHNTWDGVLKTLILRVQLQN